MRPVKIAHNGPYLHRQSLSAGCNISAQCKEPSTLVQACLTLGTYPWDCPARVGNVPEIVRQTEDHIWSYCSLTFKSCQSSYCLSRPLYPAVLCSICRCETEPCMLCTNPHLASLLTLYSLVGRCVALETTTQHNTRGNHTSFTTLTSVSVCRARGDRTSGRVPPPRTSVVASTRP